MAEIKELLAYLLLNYPHKDELSNARVTKMVYLCDWKHCIDYGTQITNIKWFFDNYGPFVWDVVDTAKNNKDLFAVEYSHNYSGGSKRLLFLQSENYHPRLKDTEIQVANHVINVTKSKSWDGFIKLVYSTFPIVKSERYKSLNLPKLACEYKNSLMY